MRVARVAVVTGGTAGIGLATAHAYPGVDRPELGLEPVGGIVHRLHVGDVGGERQDRAAVPRNGGG
jgi:hypothetical protein